MLNSHNHCLSYHYFGHIQNGRLRNFHSGFRSNGNSETKYIVVVRNNKTGDVKTLHDTRPVNSVYKEGDRVAVDYIGAAPQTIK